MISLISPAILPAKSCRGRQNLLSWAGHASRDLRAASHFVINHILTHAQQLQKYLSLDQKGKVIAEYVWIDSTGGTRSKSRVGPPSFFLTKHETFDDRHCGMSGKISLSIALSNV
jgi:hypothetical protein